MNIITLILLRTVLLKKLGAKRILTYDKVCIYAHSMYNLFFDKQIYQL